MNQKVLLLSLMLFGCFSTMMAQDFHEVIDLDIELGWDKATVVDELDSDYKFVKEVENRAEYSGGEFEDTELVRTYLDYNKKGYLEAVLMVLKSKGIHLGDEEVYHELEDEYGEPHYGDLSPVRSAVFTTSEMLQNGVQIPDEYTSRGYAGWAGVNETPIMDYNKTRIYVHLVEHNSGQRFLIVVYGYTSDRAETVEYPSGRVEKCTFYINDKKSKSIGWYESGEREYEEEYVDGELSGVRTTFYKNGTKKVVTSYERGKKSGEEICWYESGQKQKTGGWRDDKGDGIWVYWYENGKKQKEGEWKDGKKDGVWVCWYENGKKKEEAQWKDGAVFGRWVLWYENGVKMQEGELRAGEKVGKWVYWYESGKTKEEGEWKNGNKEGAWNYYDEDGNRRSVRTYAEGKYNGDYIEYHENGRVSCKLVMKNGEKNGYCTWYFKNGSVNEEGKYINGRPEGEYKWYHENGRIRCRVNNISGMREGVMPCYMADGTTLQKEITFKKGQRVKVVEYYTDGSGDYIVCTEPFYNESAGTNDGVFTRYNSEHEKLEVNEYRGGRIVRSIWSKWGFVSETELVEWLTDGIWKVESNDPSVQMLYSFDGYKLHVAGRGRTPFNEYYNYLVCRFDGGVGRIALYDSPYSRRNACNSHSSLRFITRTNANTMELRLGTTMGQSDMGLVLRRRR